MIALCPPQRRRGVYQPVQYSGDTMTLHYARAQELGPWLDLVAARGEVVVPFWLRLGEAAVALGVGRSSGKSGYRSSCGGFCE